MNLRDMINYLLTDVNTLAAGVRELGEDILAVFEPHLNLAMDKKLIT